MAYYEDWFKLSNDLDGGIKPWSELPESSKQALVQKCLYFCRAYEIALQSKGK
jgi:hypothetical protein